jgi:hypothetical protein
MPYILQILPDFPTWLENLGQKILDTAAILVVYFSSKCCIYGLFYEEVQVVGT